MPTPSTSGEIDHNGSSLNGGEEPFSMPSVEELRQEVASEDPQVSRKEEKEYEREESRKASSSAARYQKIRALESHYKHKSIWSVFLMASMGWMVIFQSALLAMVGFGIWNFSAYQWLLPALLVQNLAQIVGLVIIVVKSLFKEIES